MDTIEACSGTLHIGGCSTLLTMQSALNVKGRRTIAIVAPYFPPHSGGLERYAFEIGIALQRLEWRVVVITSDETFSRSEESGMTVYRLPYQFKISNTPFSFRWFGDIRRILKEEKPDVVNVHTPVPGIGDIAAQAARVPLLVTYHSGSMKKGIWWTDTIVALYELFVVRFMLRKAAHIVSASDAVRMGFLRKYLHKSSTLSPAVSDLFYPAPVRARELRLLFVSAQLSRAYAHKGLATVFVALQKLHVRGIRASLDIVGEGDMKATYAARVRALQLEEYVHFRGKLLGTKLADVYRQAALFVLPTSNDSYPITVLEALASGLPVISTRVGDIARMVEDGKTGFLIEPNDADALAEKVEILLHDYELRMNMGQRAREKTCAHFNWEDRAEGMDRLVRRILMPQIVHLCGYYPPHFGGIERVVRGAANILGERGWRVRVITGGGPHTIQEGTVTITKLAGFEFAHTPITPTLLFHLLRLGRQSIIHLHLAQAYWPDIVRIASRVRRIPYIAHYHLEVAPSGFFGPLFTVYQKWTWGPFLRGAVRVITCSEAQKEWVAAHYRVPAHVIHVIPNAVGDAFFATSHEAPRETFRLLSIGRLTNQKRVDRIIDACALLTIPYSLTIAGDGEERAKLEECARRAGVIATFVGPQDDTQMRELHRMHDVFLISSEREGGTPLSVLEACAGGLPIIAGDVPGVRELVATHGILTSPTPKEFAADIESLFCDKVQYRSLSQKSIALARSHDWQRYADSLERLYRTI